MSKKRESLKVEPRFVHSGHGVGLSITPGALAGESSPVHGAHYLLPGGAGLTSPNGSRPRGSSLELRVNGSTFAIRFKAAHGNVESQSPDVDGQARQFMSTASIENLQVIDVTDRRKPQVRVEAKLLSAGALSKSYPLKRQGGSHARPGQDGPNDTDNVIQGLKLDGKPVKVKVDRNPLHLFPTLKGLVNNFKGEFKKQYAHRFLRKGRSLPRNKVFATLVDLADGNGSKNGFHHKVCSNPRAAGKGHVIYLDGLGRLELGLAWRSAHALRIQMLRMVFDPTVRVENHQLVHPGGFPLSQPFSRSAAAQAGRRDAAIEEARSLQASQSLDSNAAQAEAYCADVESCGGHYPPP